MNTPNRNYNSFQNKVGSSPNAPIQKWGSPATNSSVRFSPYQNPCNGGSFVNRSPISRHNTPRFNNYQNNNNFSFRTPQPIRRHSSPHSRSWTGGDNRKQLSFINHNMPFDKRFPNIKNPRFDPNCNPGGSNDIEQYYQSSMIQDPWQFLKPCPISGRPVPTT